MCRKRDADTATCVRLNIFVENKFLQKYNLFCTIDHGEFGSRPAFRSISLRRRRYENLCDEKTRKAVRHQGIKSSRQIENDHIQTRLITASQSLSYIYGEKTNSLSQGTLLYINPVQFNLVRLNES